MAKNLLITGRPGSGKTTLVERLLASCPGGAGGFLTREIRERGVRHGFRIETLEGRSDVLAHDRLPGPIRVGKYGVNAGAIERLAVPAIQHAVARGQLVVIDEIGRMESASPAFRQAVIAALDSPCTVLATIQLRPDPFADTIKARPDARLFEIDSSNREAVRAAIERML